MPFLSGSISVRCYKVTQPIPDAYLAPFQKALARHAFRPIDDRKGQTESAGWVNARNLLDTRMDPDSWHFSPYLVVGFRRDRKALPAALLRARVDEAVRRTLKQERRPRLSKEERTAVEAQVKTELLQQTIATPQVTEVAWNLELNRLYVASTSSTVNDAIVGLFSETFEQALLPQVPYLVAEEYAEQRNVMRALEGSFSADFAALARQSRVERRAGVREVGA